MYNKTHIVIVTYNGMAWLKKCLDSCNGHQIIIVDNNSKDETISFIENNYPKVKLFKQTSNLGFGKANNLGISYALSQGAEHVFLLNQDAYIVDDCLDNLVEYQKNNPEYGVLSPVHITASKDKLDKNFAGYMSYSNNENFYSDFVLNKTLQSIYTVSFVNAAAWLLSKNVLETIGGFDPLFFHYGEDNNYCQRVIFHGFNIGVIPQAFIIHDREYREPEIKNTIEKKLKNKELVFKSKWANINVDCEKEICNYKRVLKIKLIKSIFNFKFEKTIFYKKELELINEILPRIAESRLINITKGSHFLY